MGLFGPRLPVDDDELEWQLATSKWLTAEFGPLRQGSLVLPTSDWFSPHRATSEEEIAILFSDVKRGAGMEGWECELVRGEEERESYLGNALLLRHEGAPAPCGTFQVQEDGEAAKVLVSYNPGLAGDKAALIATFAHELGHYLMSTANSAPPGGWELHELHTDIAGVYLGFGIFLANCARNFGQFQSAGETGWTSRTQGYLNEGALVTALVIFQKMAGGDPREAAPFLKPYLGKDLSSADKILSKQHPDMLGSVEAIDLSQFR